MNFKIAFTLIALASTITGCAISHPAKMRQAISILNDKDKSYMLGRFSVSCKPNSSECLQTFNSISIIFGSSHFKGLVDRLDAVHGTISGNTSFDFVNIEKKEKGYYFCRELPPNKYTFFDLRYYRLSGQSHYLDKESYFDLPINLNPGEAVYIGNLKVTTSNSESFLGFSIPSPGVLILSKPDTEEIAK